MATHTRTIYPDLYMEDMLPALEEVTYDEWEKGKDYVGKLFNVDSMDREIKQQTTVGALGSAREVNEGADTPYVTLSPGYDKTYTALTYKLGVVATEELVEDDRHDLIEELHRELSSAHYKARNIVSAGIYHDAFTTAGYDGKALCATDHPLEEGGTGSNELAAPAALGVAGLKSLLLLFSDMVGPDGYPLNEMARTLVVPTALQFTARQLLNAIGQHDSANRTANPFDEDKLDYLCWPYLSAAQGGSDTAYYLINEPRKLKVMFYERVGFQSKSGEDFDSGGVKTKTRQRFAVGWHNWRNITGTAGA